MNGSPWRLAALLHGFAAIDVRDDREVSGLALDSRRVRRGDLFLACAGARDSGVRHIAQAVAAGAVAVACDAGDTAADTADAGIPVIRVQRLADRIGLIAARFHHQPSRELTIIGVTGTNGKTSCSHYLAQTFSLDGAPCGVIGTLGYGVPGELRPASHTTPDAITLQEELARLRAAGVRRVAMEVSSHALVQGRVVGVTFAGAVLTNLTRDHLDYHGSVEAYGQAKRRLFESPGLRFAVINRDDAFGRELMRSLRPDIICVSYGIDDDGPAAGEEHVTGAITETSLTGVRLVIDSSWGTGELVLPLLGRFNVRNALAVIAVLLLSGVSMDEALRRASALRAVPGRMERFGGDERRPLVIIDYAHTPDALEHVLSTLREHAAGRLLCVFGCGGDRDRGKRPLMGAIAARLSDRVIVTDDNPRGEDAGAIVADILAGMPAGAAVEAIADREQAIRTAVAGSVAGDVVLVAGKGHEEYQEIAGRRLPFSDRAVVTSALELAA
ncbi:MAG: UDP-N-acetylmuramoyl-L-alanyl-D-glutamate--2,6-diaminopimelate ligase [Gammaproteobacteria bacterium]|nr:UDP-N-acetylmuramoyl-L-alanyl-D-glutamate--2,6-diaminopimelate ligase [Gammaproteobacteria bacterium]